MNNDNIYKKIHGCGGRVTKIRKEILQTLFDADCLVSSPDILICLKKKKVNPNRSTLFRELSFLIKNKIITKSTISDIFYYELKDHHHHLICLSCKSICKIEIADHLIEQEKKISQKNKFNIINHTLEFYGYCHKCQS